MAITVRYTLCEASLRAHRRVGLSDSGAIHTWTFKQKNPFHKKAYPKGCAPVDDLLNSPVVELMASGQELDLIRTHFINIPLVTNSNSKCKRTGDFAKFIALNFDFKV